MVDFNKLLQRVGQFGGISLVIEYIKLGVFWIGIKESCRCAVNGKSFKQIYPVILKKIEPYLVERYTPVIEESRSRMQRLQQEHMRSKIVWFCWLQGIKQAPPIIKACFNSLTRNLQDREIKVIDNNNWKEYIELPDYIIKKWEKGRIPAALFSDLLRLELLIQYGGTWIDSTVLCTGINDNEKYLDADLFLFQYTKQGSVPISISNWFITSCTNNEVLIVLRDMLFAYWNDYDCTLDYYIFHLFFAELSKEYSEEIMAMPFGQSMNSLVLMRHWKEKYNDYNWGILTSKVSFHKLSFRVDKRLTNDDWNYYNKVISLYT